jgi:hypothetical protein
VGLGRPRAHGSRRCPGPPVPGPSVHGGGEPGRIAPRSRQGHALAECRRVLLPGGRIAFSDWIATSASR